MKCGYYECVNVLQEEMSILYIYPAIHSRRMHWRYLYIYVILSSAHRGLEVMHFANRVVAYDIMFHRLLPFDWYSISPVECILISSIATLI